VFCSSCGAAVGGGNFCAVCGASLRGDPAPRAERTDPAVWADEVRFDVIIAIPEVRERIAEHAAAGTRPMSTEEWLHHMDRAYPGHSHRAGTAGAEALISLMARKGVRASGERAQLVQRPVGWVLVDVLCRLAWSGHGLQRIRQGTEGCVLECVIEPSSRLLNGGELVITVERTGHGTGVRAVANFPGIPRDWGHSRRIFDEIFPHLT
jgi:hypothetical protein